MSPGKILLVDDDRNLVELVKLRLDAAGYEVSAALLAEDTVEAAKTHVFDLSLVDLLLSHQDGISLMEQLHLIIPEMPVIILTAYGSIESAIEAMKREAYSYITKPFDPRDLLYQIERALENRRLTSKIKLLKGLLEERKDMISQTLSPRAERCSGSLKWYRRLPPWIPRFTSQGRAARVDRNYRTL